MTHKKRKGFFSWFQSKSATPEVVADETIIEQNIVESSKASESVACQTTTALAENAHLVSALLSESTDCDNSIVAANVTKKTTLEAADGTDSECDVAENQQAVAVPPAQLTDSLQHTADLNPTTTETITHHSSVAPLTDTVAAIQPEQYATESTQTTLNTHLEQTTLEATTQEITSNLPTASVTTTEVTHRADDLEEKRQGFFLRLKNRLSKTKQQMGHGLFSLFQNKKIDENLFDELSDQLLIADVGVNTTQKLINDLRASAKKQKITESAQLFDLIKQQMSNILQQVERPLSIESKQAPMVLLMVGVNGVGKTTTIGKLAKKFQQQGKKVMLAAGDTFRAAAVEQLQVWGERNNIPVVAQTTGGDAASVIFDAVQMAKARNIDILIADTAGRLQNKAHLMDELKKIVRVIKKIIPEAPHEIILTLDAGTGQNAIAQVKLFSEAVGLTGIILTKLDGTAKGGVIFGIADQFPLAIPYIGIGESIDDLREFNANDFIEALFSTEG